MIKKIITNIIFITVLTNALLQVGIFVSDRDYISISSVVIFAVMALVSGCYLIIDTALLIDSRDSAEAELQTLRVSFNEMRQLKEKAEGLLATAPKNLIKPTQFSL